MRTLVTGGAGFIGSNLVQLLVENGHKVIVIDNLSTGRKINLSNLDVEFVFGDILDRELLESISKNIDVVFHLAASVGRQKSIDNPQVDSTINVIGTLNVIEALKKNYIPKIVFSSSAAVYGELLSSVIEENHPLNPDSPYGVSKLAAEKHLLASSSLYGFKAIGLRYFNVYGKNQRYDAYGNVIPIFANNIHSDKEIVIFGDGKQTRDFINVKDVAIANYLAATNEINTDVFNVGSGNTITINDLAMKMMKLYNKNKDGIIYAPKRAGDVIHCKADISKIRNIMKFNPCKKIDEGLQQYVEWFNSDVNII